MRVGTIFDDAQALIDEHRRSLERIAQMEAELADFAARGVYRAAQYLDQLPHTAAKERQAVVAFLRSQAAQASDYTADVLRVAALVIEHGDHLR